MDKRNQLNLLEIGRWDSAISNFEPINIHEILTESWANFAKFKEHITMLINSPDGYDPREIEDSFIDYLSIKYTPFSYDIDRIKRDHKKQLKESKKSLCLFKNVKRLDDPFFFDYSITSNNLIWQEFAFYSYIMKPVSPYNEARKLMRMIREADSRVQEAYGFISANKKAYEHLLDVKRGYMRELNSYMQDAVSKRDEQGLDKLSDVEGFTERHNELNNTWADKIEAAYIKGNLPIYSQSDGDTKPIRSEFDVVIDDYIELYRVGLKKAQENQSPEDCFYSFLLLNGIIRKNNENKAPGLPYIVPHGRKGYIQFAKQWLGNNRHIDIQYKEIAAMIQNSKGVILSENNLKSPTSIIPDPDFYTALDNFFI